MPPEHRELLHSLGINTKNDRINRIQVDLIKKYADHEKLMSGQKDFAVLHYLSMNDCEGLSWALSDPVHKVMQKVQYEHLFLPPADRAFVDEDQDEDDNNLDLDFEPSDEDSNNDMTDDDVVVLRSHVVDRPPDAGSYSSPPSSPYIEEHLALEPLQDTVVLLFSYDCET
ncbi:hypothetical protein CPB97_000349 [Podila verticillata]|nr:hypothetical protein CPB97_000349 [Podila verticillata]